MRYSISYEALVYNFPAVSDYEYEGHRFTSHILEDDPYPDKDLVHGNFGFAACCFPCADNKPRYVTASLKEQIGMEIEPVNEDELYDKVIHAVNEKTTRILNILRFRSGVYISFPAIKISVISEKNESYVYGLFSLTGIKGTHNDFAEGSKYLTRIKGFHLDVSSFYQFYEDTKNHKRFHDGLDYYIKALGETDSSTAFCLLCASLEAMTYSSNNKGAKRRLAKYTSVLLCQPKEIRELQKKMGKYYGRRSDFIHGKGVKISTQEELELREIVREFLLGYYYFWSEMHCENEHAFLQKADEIYHNPALYNKYAPNAYLQLRMMKENENKGSNLIAKLPINLKELLLRQYLMDSIAAPKNENINHKTSIDLNNKTILVTGSPGFIGANLVMRLLRELPGGHVISLDNMNDYYEVSLKEWRLLQVEAAAATSPVQHTFIRGNLADKEVVERVFSEYRPSVVVNLAAQAGVRYSIDHPDVYIESNLIGFFNILEACRHYPVEHLVYASSSSVYGGNKKVPFSVDDRVDHPVSLYAATKKSDELLAHAYSKLYNIPSTGLRFFTVYGPAGRPDMFYYSATKKLSEGGTIQIFNYGDMKRDFTYIDDIVEGILRVMQGAPEKANGPDGLPIPPYAVYNIGGGQPENLLDFVSTLQEELVRAGILPSDYDFEAHRELVGMQVGDVPITYADSEALERDYGFTPKIGIREGLRKFAEWYKEYYQI